MILVVVSFYMLWVHVPYARNQNRLNNIKREIMTDNSYDKVEYFNEYNSDQTYYIILAEKEDEKQYVVYNHEKKKIDSENANIVSEDSVKKQFVDKFEVQPTSVEFGYEMNKIVYCLKYLKGDTLIYSFYSVDNGEFIKSYKL